jgi:hypothetical protein
MKTAKELYEMSMAIGKATRAYHKAVEDNLKESGKEHNVIGDDEDYDGIYLKVREDDAVDTILVDKVRWNNEGNCVEYHCSVWNYETTDNWTPISWLGDDIDYIYNNIEW